MSSQKPPCDFCDRRLQRHGRVALGHCSYKTCFELLRIASLIGDLMLSVIKFTFVVFTGLFRLSYLRIEVTEDAISIRDTPGDWLRIWHNGCKTTIRSFDLRHVSETILHFASTTRSSDPGQTDPDCPSERYWERFWKFLECCWFVRLH